MTYIWSSTLLIQTNHFPPFSRRNLVLLSPKNMRPLERTKVAFCSRNFHNDPLFRFKMSQTTNSCLVHLQVIHHNRVLALTLIIMIKLISSKVLYALSEIFQQQVKHQDYTIFILHTLSPKSFLESRSIPKVSPRPIVCPSNHSLPFSK